MHGGKIKDDASYNTLLAIYNAAPYRDHREKFEGGQNVSGGGSPSGRDASMSGRVSVKVANGKKHTADVNWVWNKISKFRSLSHFVSYVQGVHEDAIGEWKESNRQSSDDGDFNFTLSNNLKDAYDVIAKERVEQFLKQENAIAVRATRRSSMYMDAPMRGEVDVQQAVSGSEYVWREPDSRNTKSKFVGDTLFILCSYNASSNASSMRKSAQEIIACVYASGVVPKKIVAVYASTGTINGCSTTAEESMKIKEMFGGEDSGWGRENLYTFIDIGWNDIDGIVKVMHPSTFRRLDFRRREMFGDNLDSGYGSSRNSNYKDSPYVVVVDGWNDGGVGGKRDMLYKFITGCRAEGISESESRKCEEIIRRVVKE